MNPSKKHGIPSSSLEVRELKAPARSVHKARLSALSPDEQLKILDKCRSKVNNYRQGPGVDLIIECCEHEPMVNAKTNKVFINLYSLIALSELEDGQLNEYIGTPLEDAYKAGFANYGYSDKEAEDLFDSRGNLHQTTVEVNSFVNDIVVSLIDRINCLPVTIQDKQVSIKTGKCGKTENYYNATEIRERALFYYAALPVAEKADVINGIIQKYGPMLNRYSNKQYEERVQRLKAMQE